MEFCKLSKVAKVVFGSIAAPLLLSGCASNSDAPLVDTSPKKQVSIEKGSSIAEATVLLSKEYGLEVVNWNADTHTALESNEVFAPFTIDLDEDTAQKAFDLLYKQTTYLTNVDMDSKSLDVKPFGIVPPNANVAIIKKDSEVKESIETKKTEIGKVKPEPKTKPAVQAQVPTAPTTPVPTKSKTVEAKKAEQTAAVSKLSTDSKKVTVNPSAPASEGNAIKAITDSATVKTKTYFINRNESYADNLRTTLRKEGYNLYWGEISNEMATLLSTKPENSSNLQAVDAFDFMSQMVDKINAEKVEDVSQLFSMVSYSKKHVIIHQQGYAKNASVFYVKRGWLSENVKTLAKQHGWELKDHGWMADNDYPIGIDFPLISENKFESAIVKLMSRYPTIEPKLLESTREVFIVNKSQ